MRRRDFLIFGSLLGAATCLEAKESSSFAKAFGSVEPTIRAVQEHMFPENGMLPSAVSMQATRFLFETMQHKSFDRDIRKFVIEGAKELALREHGKFPCLPAEEKERALRAYEETPQGGRWLSRIMILSMEALFSDPIYGSNIDEAGWKALHTEGGQPRPSTRYIAL